MSSPIRITGLAVFAIIGAIITALYLLFIDHFIASSIRTGGSQLLGARVDLDTANLTLGEQRLELKGLAVTNPNAPMTNLVEMQTLTLDTDTSALVWNKVVVDEVKINELRLNTERTESGALDTHWADVESWLPMDDIPNMSDITSGKLPAVAEILAKEELKTLQGIETFKADLKSSEQNLKQQFDNLPTEDDIKAYEKRINDILGSGGKKNILGLLSKGKDLKSLRKELKTELAKIKSFKTELSATKTNLSAQIKTLKSLPKEDYQRIRSRYSLTGDGTNSLIASLFGPQIADWTQRGMSYYQILAPYLNKYQSDPDSDVAVSKVLTDRGRRVLFPDQNPLPNYLVKNINVSSSPKTEDLSLAGTIANLTTEPERWDEPLTLNLTGSANYLEAFALDGILDHRNNQESKDQVKVIVTRLDLTHLAGMTNTTVVPTAGTADIDATITLENDQLNANITIYFHQLALKIERQEPWIKLAENAIQKMPRIEVNIKITGTLAKPSINLSSPDLNALAKSVVASLMQDKLAQFESQLMSGIQEKTIEPLSNLPNLDFLNQLQDSLNLQEGSLDQLLKKGI